MQKSRFIDLLLLSTLAAIAAALFWALLPMFTMLGYIHPPDWTDADLVRHIWHFRLVQPEWVSSPPRYSYTRWMVAESLARLSVVFLGWLVSITFIIRRYLRSRKKPMPNKQAMEPTVVVVVSSAMTAHVSEIARDQDIGMMIRVLVVYTVWLLMVFGSIPDSISVFIVIASPMLFGSVIWHLWKTHSLSVVNRIAFCGAIAFFPFLAIQIFVMSRL